MNMHVHITKHFLKNSYLQRYRGMKLSSNCNWSYSEKSKANENIKYNPLVCPSHSPHTVDCLIVVVDHNNAMVGESVGS